MVKQVIQMSNPVFLSLSDETKIRMHKLQFHIESSEWNDISKWIRENFINTYYVEKEGSDRYVFAYDEADAMAFKLRWM